ncbi:hypothetical protein F441_09285 [Phytophthora nicotianae CJ01A1]|uniref:C2H2-type domain-containing protein n=1 Tax=Phytophthora nicotianae CJ01A1 TaxID=1317063 RepID=W2WZW4_PHYNI|nr:hypothetical protein F441_09285 [Phytophthora nicotianae CJ01A1]
MGIVDMIQEFEAVLAMDFVSVTELFQRLRGVRNRLNRQCQEVLRVHLVMGKTSRDPVSVPIQVNFAAKIPNRNMNRQFKKAVKRKAAPFPMNNMQTDACFYCNGKFNKMNGIEPHYKKNCHKRQGRQGC